MKGIIPYLNFGGDGTEALQFYCNALDGKVLFQQTFGESPMGDKTPEEHKNRLMHASFECSAGMFMASDSPPGFERKAGNTISLSLQYGSVAEAEKAFNNLSAGGSVMMPLQETFWALRFGMLTDKYGFLWMVNVDKPRG
mgnify:CR=1 FL=1